MFPLAFLIFGDEWCSGGQTVPNMVIYVRPERLVWKNKHFTKLEKENAGHIFLPVKVLLRKIATGQDSHLKLTSFLIQWINCHLYFSTVYWWWSNSPSNQFCTFYYKQTYITKNHFFSSIYTIYFFPINCKIFCHFDYFFDSYNQDKGKQIMGNL